MQISHLTNVTDFGEILRGIARVSPCTFAVLPFVWMLFSSNGKDSLVADVLGLTIFSQDKVQRFRRPHPLPQVKKY